MLKLEVVTPEKKLVDKDVDSVTVPTSLGEAGILPHHAPLISTLKPGVLSFAVKGNTQRVAVSSGFVEVSNDRVSVLADHAETLDAIDIAAARVDKEEAERALASSEPGEEQDALRVRAEYANARIQAVGR